jgi:hypothetical protein
VKFGNQHLYSSTSGCAVPSQYLKMKWMCSSSSPVTCQSFVTHFIGTPCE